MRKKNALVCLLALFLQFFAPIKIAHAEGLTYEDLNNWTATGGTWQVQPGGRTVYQTTNGSAYYFLSPEADVIDRTIQGTITVDANQGDNDFIGFTMGYQNNSNNYVFAWDKGGWGLSGYGKELWKMENGSKTHLATDLSVDSSKGWVNGVTYDFRILYMSNKIRVSIDGVTIFDVDGTFPAGKFGFYNESQGQVTYGNVKSAPGSLTEVVPVVGDDSYGMDQNTTLTKDSSAGIFANDYDPNLDAFTATLVTDVSHGTLNLNTTDGSFTYTPTADWTGVDTFIYKLTDNDGDSANATVTISVSEPNVAPTNISLSNNSIIEGNSNGVTIGTFSTTDANTNESFDYSLLNNSGGKFGVSGNELIITNTSALTVGTYTIEVRSTDLRGLYYDKEFSIQITPDNQAPTNITVQNQLTIDDVTENGTIVGTLSVTDPDEGDTHTLTLTDSAGGTFEIINSNQIAVADTSKLTPPSQQITVRATDSEANTYEKNITITINSAPAEIQNLSLQTNDPSNTQITWEDNKSDNSHLDYDINTSYRNTKENANESANLELLDCATYNYRVRAEKNGEEIVGADKTLTTSGCVGDAEVLVQNRNDISNTQGGSVALSEGESSVALQVPQNVTSSSSNVQFQIKKLESSAVLGTTSTPNAEVSMVSSKIYDFKALSDVNTSITEFSKKITISLTYTDDEIKGLDEGSLRIYRWHDNEWQNLDNCVVNGETNTISCQTDKFSVFGLFGEGSNGDSSLNGKAKTIRWAGMKRGEVMSASPQVVNKENFVTYYEKSQTQVAMLNQGIPGTIQTTLNRWGEEVFLAYVPGRMALDRFPYRFQNLIAFTQRVMQPMPLIGGMHAAASEFANWTDKYQSMKQTYQKPVERLHASAPTFPKEERRTLAEDQVRSHLRQREYNRNHPVPFYRFIRDISEMHASSRIKRTKNMKTVKMCQDNACVSMEEYLQGWQ